MNRKLIIKHVIITLIVLMGPSCWGSTIDPQKAFVDALEQNDLGLVKDLLRQHVNINVNAIDDDGWPAIRIAAMACNNDMVNLLLDLGANVNAADSLGRTALRAAAVLGCSQVVQTLLDRGADIDQTDNDGLTASAAAAKYTVSIFPNTEVKEILKQWKLKQAKQVAG